MTDSDKPEPPVSVPSSVKKSHYEAEKAEKEAGESVPVDALEELVEEWEENADKTLEYLRERQEEGKNIDYCDAKERNLSRCAHDLESVIEEHTNE